ncbi:MAG: methionine synthase [Thermotogaceae bacterium]|nr:methionine synthase [Thermotogaceae bacterium]
MPRVVEIDPTAVKVPERVISARLGFKGVGRIPEEFRNIFEKAWREITKVSTPFALLEDEECVWNEYLKVREIELKSDLVRKHLKNCEIVTLMVVTLGENVDRKIEEAHEGGDELLSYFLDGIASEFVEYIAREIEKVLRKDKEPLVGGARISPGYGDFSLEMNKWIVEILDGERYGIKYHPESFMLIPRKTIASIMGWRGSE